MKEKKKSLCYWNFQKIILWWCFLCRENKQVSVSHSVVSLRPHGLQLARLLCPWDRLKANWQSMTHSEDEAEGRMEDGVNHWWVGLIAVKVPKREVELNRQVMDVCGMKKQSTGKAGENLHHTSSLRHAATTWAMGNLKYGKIFLWLLVKSTIIE